MIYILPGMGANSKMYDATWHGMPSWTCIDWPQYQGETSLSEIAQRLIDLYNITSEDEVWGSSLGGMVACEIAQYLGCRRVVLLGSATHPDEVRTVLNYFSSLVDITPIRLVQKLAGKSNESLLEMFAGADARFIKAMCKAIFQWQGLQNEEIKVVRIHGSKDLVIPCPRLVDLKFDAGHLIAMSHSCECIDYLTNI